MLVVIGADVDPRLPGMRRRPGWDPWDPLELIPKFEAALGADLPPITWLLRADDTIRHVTGAFDSCYLTRQDIWTRLRARGHELGWHFHHWTFGATAGGFDPNPPWLADAHAALSRHFAIRATRTGWDYCNSGTMRRLANLGITIDFSSLPGQLVWWSIDGERILVDWHPRLPGRIGRAATTFSSPAAVTTSFASGNSRLRRFGATPVTMAKRVVWRVAHGELSLAGVAKKTRMMTQPWPCAPYAADVLAFHFHPEELTPEGIASFSRNVALLKRAFDPEFVTASEAASWLAGGRGTLKPA